MNRKEYWDRDYLKYWKERVEEASYNAGESRIVPKDPITGGDRVIRDLISRHAFQPGNVLEVGCAWGRWFGFYREHGLNVYGVDISLAMVEAANKDWKGKPGIQSILEAEAEALPFENNFFDNVTCLAVFDATFQHQSLRELLRVLKTSNRLYLTGKGDRYDPDDRQALDAEVGARSKGHPNFFTNVPGMIDQLRTRKHHIISSWYYPRRGDFARNHFATDMLDHFYEWFLIIEKGSDQIDFEPFANDHSQTFLKLGCQ